MRGVEGPPTGGKVEADAIKWGEQQLGRTLSRRREAKKGPVIRIVDKEVLAGPLSFPKLVEQDPRLASLRLDPYTGHVYVPFWWEVPVVQVEDKRRSIKIPGSYVQLLTGREKEVSLTDLPNRPVRRLLMKESPSVEKAIRQAYHIQERQIGEEAEQLDLVWAQINQIWQTVLEKGVNEAKIDELASETARFLEEAGLTGARKKAKINIQDRLTAVFQADSLGRFNPLIQRVRLRSAYLNAVGLEAFSILVREKFAAIGGVLWMEREITRQALTDAINALDTIMGFTKRGAYLFEDEGGKPWRGEPEGLEVAFRGVINLLARPRVAPYLQTARAAGIALYGCRPEYLGINKVVLLRDPQASTDLFDPNFVPVRDLVKRGDFTQAKELSRIRIYEPILKLLDNAVVGVDLP